MKTQLILAAAGIALGAAACNIDYKSGKGSSIFGCDGGSCGCGEVVFCLDGEDCPSGQSCDVEANECVAPAPVDPPPGCVADTDCGAGSYCDEASGTCVTSSVCTDHTDCLAGQYCNEVLQTCLPGDPPTPACADWHTEAECVAQVGCEPVYAGVDCSCGPNCTCTGNEPGCVCDSFEFFKCVDAQ